MTTTHSLNESRDMGSLEKIMRRVDLPATIAGHLWLGPMPGRFHSLRKAMAAYQAKGVDHIVCLTARSEIAEKSPEYAACLDETPPVPVTAMPIADFGVPADEKAYGQTVSQAADALRSGKRLFVHCAAGIGRTGTFAACLLISLGFEESAALALIRKAGSGPETQEQAQLVHRFGRGA